VAIVGGFGAPARAFVWTQADGFVDYGIEDPTVEDQQARCSAVNASGHIVGRWNQHVSNIHAIAGEVGAPVVSSMSADTAAFPTGASGLNDAGVAVGIGLAVATPDLVPVQFAADGTFTIQYKVHRHIIVGGQPIDCATGNVDTAAQRLGITGDIVAKSRASLGDALALAPQLGDKTKAFVLAVRNGYTDGLIHGMVIGAVIVALAGVVAFVFLPARAVDPLSLDLQHEHAEERAAEAVSDDRVAVAGA